MKRATLQSRKGTVLLVALCFVTVLGISLAGYIAVCSRTMQVSNRTFQTGLSQQLAEMGLEEAMRAFNKNDWSDWSNGVSADWTVSGTTATCTLTFPAGKFGQGVTGSVKIRVDNYNSTQITSNWATGISYRTSDTVNYNGTWYRCVRATSSQTPNGFANMAYWVPTPIPSFWSSSNTYKAEDVVYYTSTNTWYRCILAPTANEVPTNGTYWTAISKISLDNGYSSINGELLMYFGTWYRYNSGWSAMPSTTPIVNWIWRSGYNYSYNDLVYYGSTPIWYRCVVPHTSSGSILPTNTSYWENALASGSNSGSWAWASTTAYNLNDVVYRSGNFYRCILAHTNQGPPNATYWSAAPLRQNAWDSGRLYSQNDTVYFNGVWYLSIANSNVGNLPPMLPATNSWWVGADTTTGYYQWNRSTAYVANDYRCYGGVWYRCLVANTGESPNNNTYWTAAWAQSSGVTTGATVIYAEGTINIAGSGSTKTQLRATVAPAPLFPNAVGSTSTLTITSGTGTVDSYNNSLGTTYASQVGNTATNYSAVLAASTSLAINGTTAVKGYLAWPSPPAGISSGTTVHGPSSPGSPNIDTTRVSRSPYVPQFSTLPGPNLATAFSSANFAKGTEIPASYGSTITLGTPGATTPSIYYFNGDLDIGTDSGYDMTSITIEGPVILYVNGNLRTRTNGAVYITATGSAEIHYTGYLRTYAGSIGFQNATLDPKKLVLIGDTTSTSTTYLAAAPNPLAFYGVVYMPNTTATLGLDIRTGVEIYGAISAKKVTFSSEANVHYDTSLRYATTPGVDQPYAITDWRELDGTERITMP